MLSKVDAPEDLDKAIREVAEEYSLTADECADAESKLSKALANPVAGKWFGSGVVSLKEREVISEYGVVLRPDRVVQSGDGTIVIDYKFGEVVEDRYKKQVGGYMGILRSAGFANVTGYIWYVTIDKIVPV